jgi:hypothetical protein
MSEWRADVEVAVVSKLLRHLVKNMAVTETGFNPELEPELEGPVRLQVVAGPCNRTDHWVNAARLIHISTGIPKMKFRRHVAVARG